MSAAAPVGSTPASSTATAGASKAAMMFFRASNKVQQDKSKDLVVSIESVKAELSGNWFGVW
jgi:hypothetical protein